MSVFRQVKPFRRLAGLTQHSFRSITPSLRCSLKTSACARHPDDNEKRHIDPKPRQFDESMLKYIVCPLSKSPLRYAKQSNELICDQLGVAYPIIKGIPNLIPQDARKLSADKPKS